MPYIKQAARPELDKHIDRLNDMALDPGELTYIIYKLLLYICHRNRCYATYATVVGIVSCVKDELYRREIVPYEDQKIIENGDVNP
jgi:hypothetical protein